LRHQGDELAVGRDVRKVGYWEALAADNGGEGCDLGVGDCEELFEEAQFIEEVERGGMDGVSPKIAEEVLVLFENGDLDAGAGEEKAQHDACGPASDDAAGRGERVWRHSHRGMRVARPPNVVKSKSQIALRVLDSTHSLLGELDAHSWPDQLCSVGLRFMWVIDFGAI
jgi:hypothetical protein